jgi:hypothetical protein
MMRKRKKTVKPGKTENRATAVVKKIGSKAYFGLLKRRRSTDGAIAHLSAAEMAETELKIRAKYGAVVPESTCKRLVSVQFKKHWNVREKLIATRNILTNSILNAVVKGERTRAEALKKILEEINSGLGKPTALKSRRIPKN